VQEDKNTNPTSTDINPEIDRLQGTIERQFAEMDKAILAYSTGALALVIGFIGKLTPSPAPETKWLLYGGAGLLCMAILVTVLSFFCSTFECLIDIVSLHRINSQKPSLRPDLGIYDASTRWKVIWRWIRTYWLIYLLNMVSLFSFVSGIVLVVIFILKNTWK